MKNEEEIREALKDKKEKLHIVTNPPISKQCKLCGHSPPMIIGGDEPWANIGFHKSDTLRTEIRILEWILDEK